MEGVLYCICNCLVDYTKAFDTVWHEGLWATLGSYGVDGKLLRIIRIRGHIDIFGQKVKKC